MGAVREAVTEVEAQGHLSYFGAARVGRADFETAVLLRSIFVKPTVVVAPNSRNGNALCRGLAKDNQVHRANVILIIGVVGRDGYYIPSRRRQLLNELLDC